ncbi:hypothetical protein [Parabacteroides sp. FAFU027]|uniref:hypothetical protein n=1 Tax=Parabacteroides sp. FAFU027 TaxID=2922715 RepID=UPI001FAFC799|nr:hypothetical protein [Parabacteroides sp. FAFU027]
MRKLLILTCLIALLCAQKSYAGPPFNTDDPEPVEYKHWEYYVSTVNNYQQGVWSGTSPHFEVNYGLVPDVQIHLLMPVNYTTVPHQKASFGYTETEVGVKFRFLQETDSRPQGGIFPIIEVPTIKNETFSNGKAKIFIPVWAQKSWGKLTTYGGMGYWINPGEGNRNYIFSGWEVQYDFSPTLMLGGELYYHSSDAIGVKPVTAFNLGGSINASPKVHLIFSAGHSLVNGGFFTSYLGLLLTI